MIRQDRLDEQMLAAECGACFSPPSWMLWSPDAAADLREHIAKALF